MIIPRVHDRHPDGTVRRRRKDDGRKAVAHPPKAERQYFLEVEIEVAARNQVQYFELSHGLVDIFKEAGLTLWTSTLRTDCDPIRIVNYWDLGDDADVLLEAELSLPDVPEFNVLNNLIDREVKRIVIPFAAPERTAFEPAGQLSDYRYLRVQTSVEAYNLAEFNARVEGYIAPFTRDAGWYLGDTYYGVTGKAGRVSQLWIIPAEHDSRRVDELFKKVGWLKDDVAIKGTTTFDILGATASDPNLGGGNGGNIMSASQGSTTSAGQASPDLHQIGARGLVVHDGDPDAGKYRYCADNNDESWRQLEVSAADLAAQLGGAPWQQIQQLLSGHAPLGVVQAPAGKKAYVVNLDSCVAEPSTVTLSGQVAVPPLDTEVFLMVEKGRYYAVSELQLTDLDDKGAGEAKVLVRRGAVIAAIPHNTNPYGTNCVLVNLTQLLP